MTTTYKYQIEMNPNDLNGTELYKIYSTGIYQITINDVNTGGCYALFFVTINDSVSSISSTLNSPGSFTETLVLVNSSNNNLTLMFNEYPINSTDLFTYDVKIAQLN